MILSLPCDSKFPFASLETATYILLRILTNSDTYYAYSYALRASQMIFER